MEFSEDKEKLLILRNLISDKEIVFEAILSEFKEVKPEFELSFNEYEDYKQTLKNNNEGSGESLEFYQCFLAFEKNIQMISKKRINVLLLSLSLRRKIMNHHYEISNHILKCFIINIWSKKKGDEVVIGDISVTNEKN